MPTSRRKIAYLGPKGSYTHQATLSISRPTGDQRDEESGDILVSKTSIADVFTAVASGETERGVVPFENSTNGHVALTLDVFGKGLSAAAAGEGSLEDVNNQTRTSNLTTARGGLGKHELEPAVHATAEVFVAVRHCLLANHASPSESSQTGTVAERRKAQLRALAQVKTICTHPQAWTQCHAFLTSSTHPFPALAPAPAAAAGQGETQQTDAEKEGEKELLEAARAAVRSAEKIDVSSTSRAAELAAADASGRTAAIASQIAGEVYGVPVLVGGIQDREDNVTRFLVLQRPNSPAALGPAHDGAREASIEAEDEAKEGRQDLKALLGFSISHFTRPGALAHSLAVFEKYALNITSINARPSGSKPWHYIFFLEISFAAEAGAEGGRTDAWARTALEDALAELDSLVEGWSLLGSWRSRPLPFVSPS